MPPDHCDLRQVQSACNEVDRVLRHINEAIEARRCVEESARIRDDKRLKVSHYGIRVL